MASTTTTQQASRLVAIRRYAGFNVSAPGANTAIFTAMTSGDNASACRVTVALTTSSVLNAGFSDGSDTHKVGLNESGALNAADLYTFTFAWPSTDGTNDLTLTLEVETDGVIELLVVDEIQGSVV